MELEWQNTDSSSDYTYTLEVQSKYGSNKTNSSHKAVTLKDLVPGTLYNITIFPEVSHVVGESSFTTQYTRKSLRMPGQGLFSLALSWRVGSKRWFNNGKRDHCVSGLQGEKEAA